MLTNAGRFIDRNPGIIPVRISSSEFEQSLLNYPTTELLIPSQAGKLFNVSGETSGDCLQIPQRVGKSKTILLSTASWLFIYFIKLKVKGLITVRLTVSLNSYLPILASQARNRAKVSSNNATRSSKREGILWQSQWSWHRFSNCSWSQHEILTCCTYFVWIIFVKLSYFLSSFDRFVKLLLESTVIVSGFVISRQCFQRGVLY